MPIQNKLRIGALLGCSEANGPGKRFVIWMQGCEKACRKCINPQFQDIKGGYEISFKTLFKKIKNSIEDYGIEGITFSGGEPLYQAKCLYMFVKKIKRKLDIDIFMFTGFTYDELNQVQKDIWDMCNIIVSGKYIYDRKCDTGHWLSSSNQKLSLNPKFEGRNVTNKISSEINIKEDGTVVITGLIDDFEIIKNIINDLTST